MPEDSLTRTPKIILPLETLTPEICGHPSNLSKPIWDHFELSGTAAPPALLLAQSSVDSCQSRSHVEIQHSHII